MKYVWLLTFLTIAACSSSDEQQFLEKLSKVQQQVDAGNYAESRKELSLWLQDTSLTVEQSAALKFELERMTRIEKDFNKSFADIKAYLTKYAKGVSEQQLEQWNADGELEYKIIDGNKRYFRSAGYNLFQLNDDALALREGYTRFVDRGPLYSFNQHHVDVVNETLSSGKTTTKQQTIMIKYSITVDADAVPEGEIVKAWIPYPREIEGRQTDIKLLATSHRDPIVAPNSNLQRTVYLQTPSVKGQKTEFWVEYQYNTNGVYHDIEATKVIGADLSDEALKPFVTEQLPHIEFTPELKALNKQIVGDETNPYKIAKKLFAYVDATKWGTAREYSTLRNLSMRAYEAPYADCGQQSMLLITLLRMNGIPARWQSGWEFSNGSFDTMHDWSMVYFAPYGWVPMDVTHGQLDSSDPKLKWFYLGGIDAYRLIFNDDYSQPFSPVKTHFRSETVDSQRGEVEWQGGNVYFDQWRYNMEWQVIEPAQEFVVDDTGAQQVVLVITDSDDAIQGELSAFDLVDDQWQQSLQSFPIVVGRTGLAWGLGLHPAQDGVHKREGDGKAPAGVFSLSSSFGALEEINTGLDYQQMSKADYCIDVNGSPLYNQTVDKNEVGEDAIQGSSEPMRRDLHGKDQLYKKGIFVDHNPNYLSGQGSCIFVHLWRGEDRPTAGCTAMEEGNMDNLLAWLNKDKKPVMVALTRQNYEKLKQQWQLP